MCIWYVHVHIRDTSMLNVYVVYYTNLYNVTININDKGTVHFKIGHRMVRTHAHASVFIGFNLIRRLIKLKLSMVVKTPWFNG